MILIDTSAWVEFLRGSDSQATTHVRGLLSGRSDEVVATEPVAMELLAGARDELTVTRIEKLLAGLPALPVDEHLDYRAAASLYRLVRRNGETVRSLVDCLIAAVALRHGATVVHQDRDFAALARATPLEHHDCNVAGS